MAPQPELVDHGSDPRMARQEAHPTELDRMLEALDLDGHQPPADPVRPLEQHDGPLGPRPFHGVGNGRPSRARTNDRQVQVDADASHAPRIASPANRMRLESAR
jgi:hypothetical protein